MIAWRWSYDYDDSFAITLGLYWLPSLLPLFGRSTSTAITLVLILSYILLPLLHFPSMHAFIWLCRMVEYCNALHLMTVAVVISILVIFLCKTYAYSLTWIDLLLLSGHFRRSRHIWCNFIKFLLVASAQFYYNILYPCILFCLIFSISFWYSCDLLILFVMLNYFYYSQHYFEILITNLTFFLLP